MVCPFSRWATPLTDLRASVPDGERVCPGKCVPVSRIEGNLPRLGSGTDLGAKSIRFVGYLPRGKPIELQTMQFNLLAYLARHRGIVLTRAQLLNNVWGYEYQGDTRTVDVHIRWLREKLEEDPAHPKLLQTVRGVGYVLRT